MKRWCWWTLSICLFFVSSSAFAQTTGSIRVRIGERMALDLGIRADRFESTGLRTATDPNP